MTRLTKESVLRWTLVLLSMLPAAFFAYLGSFSRLMRDDYRHFSAVENIGAWSSVVHWWQSWNASYSVNILHSLLVWLGAPAIVPIIPTIIIVLWILGLTWVISLILRELQVLRNRLPIAVALAALALAATINAFYTLESIYWYSASVRYAFPVGILAIILAATFEFAGRRHSRRSLTVAMLLAAATCFINAGFSEMQMTFQLLYLSLFLGAIGLYIRRSRRRALLILVFSGLVGTVVSAIIQLTAPGTAYRMASADVVLWAHPVRLLPDLIDRTLNLTLQYMGHQEAFAGFMLLFGVGLCATMTLYRPKPRLPEYKLHVLPVSPFLFVLITQLVFVPLLWTHLSDTRQFFGRFSPAFMSLVAINIGIIVTISLLVFICRRGDTQIKTSTHGLMLICGSVLLVATALFIMTQFRSIHYKAASYLFLTALTLMAMLGWQLSVVLSDLRVWKYGGVALLSSALAVVAIAMPSAVGLYFYGVVFVRVLASTTLLQVSSGLIWGAYLGFLIQLIIAGSKSRTWHTRFSALGLLLAATVIIGIVSTQIRQFPQFATFAEEWDIQHAQLVSMRDNGVSRAELPPYTFDLTAYISVVHVPIIDSIWEAEYYGLEFLARTDAGN